MTMKRIMKRKALPLAVSSVVAAWSGVSYAGGPIDGDWYGLINLSTEHQEVDVTGRDQKHVPPIDITNQSAGDYLMSNASRLGVKGSIKLTDDLKGIYKAEFQVKADDGITSATNTSTFDQRNIYAGIQSKKWGTVFAGKNDTPFKLARLEVDQFRDLTYGDEKNLLTNDNRSSNIVNYTSPMFAGFQASVATILPENSSTYVWGDWAGGYKTANSKAQNGALDSTSTMVSWKDGETAMVAFAYDANMPASLTVFNVTNPAKTNSPVGSNYTTPYGLMYNSGTKFSELVNAWRLAGQITLMDSLQLGLILQQGKTSHESYVGYNVDAVAGNDLVLGTRNNYTGYVMSAAYTLDKFVFKAQYGQNQIDSKSDTPGAGVTSDKYGWTPYLAKSSVDISQIALGVDYKLAKNTTLYAFGVELDSSMQGKNLGVLTGDNKVDGKSTTMGVGIIQKF